MFTFNPDYSKTVIKTGNRHFDLTIEPRRSGSADRNYELSGLPLTDARMVSKKFALFNK